MGRPVRNLQEALRRLAVIVPLTLLMILGVLSVSLGGLQSALLIFPNVPLAVAGGLLALWARGLPLSISAAIGFIALLGIAMLNGVVLVSRIQALRFMEAVGNGAIDRLGPVIMTALVASVGFLPMAVSTGMGAEVQRPFATVVISGIVTSTLLTLLISRPFMHASSRKRPLSAPCRSRTLVPFKEAYLREWPWRWLKSET